RGRMPIRNQSRLDLHVAHVVAQVEVEVAGEVPHRVAEFRELLLQGDALGHGELAVISRPLALNRSAPAHAVGEVGRRQRVDIGICVALDAQKLGGDQEGGAAGAAWEKKNPLAGCRHWAPVAPLPPQAPPIVEGTTALPMVEARRNGYFDCWCDAG